MLIDGKYDVERLCDMSEGTGARAINVVAMIKVRGGDCHSFIEFCGKGYPLSGSPSTFSHQRGFAANTACPWL